MPTLSIRLDLAPGIRVEPGKIRPLEAIAAHGPISAAGRAFGMSYRRAWLLVDELDRAFAEPVVAGQVGGPGRRARAAAAPGERLIASYRAVEREAMARHLAGIEAVPAPR